MKRLSANMWSEIADRRSRNSMRSTRILSPSRPLHCVTNSKYLCFLNTPNKSKINTFFRTFSIVKRAVQRRFPKVSLYVGFARTEFAVPYFLPIFRLAVSQLGFRFVGLFMEYNRIFVSERFNSILITRTGVCFSTVRSRQSVAKRVEIVFRRKAQNRIHERRTLSTVTFVGQRDQNGLSTHKTDLKYRMGKCRKYVSAVASFDPLQIFTGLTLF